MSKNQIAWERIFRKVIHLSVKLKLKTRVEKMCFIPNHIRELHSGNKLFYRPNITLTVHLRVYYHTLTQCVEVVPHLVQMALTKLSQSNLEDCVEDAQDPKEPVKTVFMTLPRIYLDYIVLLGCAMGMHCRTNSAGIRSEDSLSASTTKVSIYQSGSLDLCLGNVVGSFVHSHLKMTKPRRMSTRPHGFKRMGSSSRHLAGSMGGSSLRLSASSLDTSEMSEGPTSPIVSPPASRSASPHPARSSSPVINSSSADPSRCSSPYTHSGPTSAEGSPSESRCTSPHIRETPTALMDPSKSRTLSQENSGASGPEGCASPSTRRLFLSTPLSPPQSHSTTRTGIAFDSPVMSPGGGLLRSVTLPTWEEVKLNIRDYCLVFDETELLKIVDKSPIIGTAPEGLVPIRVVGVDQVNVFYEPKLNGVSI